MQPEIEKLLVEIEALKETGRRAEADAVESIQVIVESGAAQVFGLQEALAKSEVCTMPLV